jgi:hypothetical protein
MQGLLVQSSEIMFRDLAVPAHSRAREDIAPARKPAAKFITLGRAVMVVALAIAATIAVGFLTGAGPHPLIVVSLTAGVLVACHRVAPAKVGPRPRSRRSHNSPLSRECGASQISARNSS